MSLKLLAHFFKDFVFAKKNGFAKELISAISTNQHQDALVNFYDDSGLASSKCQQTLIFGRKTSKAGSQHNAEDFVSSRAWFGWFC